MFAADAPPVPDVAPAVPLAVLALIVLAFGFAINYTHQEKLSWMRRRR